jgi:hypothetical protein
MIMIRTLLTLAAGIGVGVAVTFAADHDHHKAVKVTQLSQRDIIEKLDGKAASATVVEVTFEPGQKDSPHRHTGPVFGCTSNPRSAVHENQPTSASGGPESLAFENARQAGDHSPAEQTVIPARP